MMQQKEKKTFYSLSRFMLEVGLHTMDVLSQSSSQCSCITEGGADKSLNQSKCILSQSVANGTTQEQSMLGADSSPFSPPPICTPPSSSSASPPHSSTCNSFHYHHHRHQSTNQKRLPQSHASFQTDTTHIKEVAGDDCCFYCLLACLFCELSSMCSALGECLACGGGVAGCCDAACGCCCCMEVAGEAACTEEACQATLDCGLLENCCGSSDCLEICLECCSICFPV
ncbi:myoD family inhibitor isoform X3 [Thalassophryne amazonica]|uniref:myoD family inhibitor isoform X3 n=1 Tax=Thalassophryne amazonica TaxID=390379 RepID=UPI00147114B7|nr:myoD family inhibitor isoform X3 [Thalassophryne amazonica]